MGLKVVEQRDRIQKFCEEWNQSTVGAFGALDPETITPERIRAIHGSTAPIDLQCDVCEMVKRTKVADIYRGNTHCATICFACAKRIASLLAPPKPPPKRPMLLIQKVLRNAKRLKPKKKGAVS